MHSTLALASIALGARLVLANGIEERTYTTEAGQYGYNGCDGTDGQSSLCQTVVMNNLNDFCLWGPPTPNQSIGDSERYEVAWCTQAGHGTRVIPEGTITGAHWVETPNYIQVTGIGNFVHLNIAAGDEGGELDPHGADGNGNPIGAQVFNNGVQIAEWTSFISANEFCFRFCKAADDAWLYCQHIYDLQGCAWNEPGDYGRGFDSCDGDSVEYPGVYVTNGVTSTYFQGTDENHPSSAPPAHPAGATSNCQVLASLGGGLTAQAQPTTSASSYSASSAAAPVSSSISAAESSSYSYTPSSSDSSYSSAYSSSLVSSSVSSIPSSASSSASMSTVTSTASRTTSAATALLASVKSAAPSSSNTVKAASAGNLKVGAALAFVAGAVVVFA